MSDNNNNLWRWRHEHKQPHNERQKQFYIYVMVASYTHLHKVEGLNKLICHLIDIQHKIQVTLAVIKETGRSQICKWELSATVLCRRASLKARLVNIGRKCSSRKRNYGHSEHMTAKNVHYSNRPSVEGDMPCHKTLAPLGWFCQQCWNHKEPKNQSQESGWTKISNKSKWRKN